MGRYDDSEDDRHDDRRRKKREDSSDEDRRGRGRDDDRKGGKKDKAKDKAKGILDDMMNDSSSDEGKGKGDKNKFSKKLKDTGGRSGPQAAKGNPGGNLWYFQNDKSLPKACLNSQLQFPQDYQPYSEEDSKKLGDAYNGGRDLCDMGKWIIYFNQTVDANSIPRRLIPAPGEHVQVRQGTDQPLEKFRAATLPSNWNPAYAPQRPTATQPPQPTHPQQIQVVQVPVEVPTPVAVPAGGVPSPPLRLPPAPHPAALFGGGYGPSPLDTLLSSTVNTTGYGGVPNMYQQQQMGGFGGPQGYGGGSQQGFGAHQQNQNPFFNNNNNTMFSNTQGFGGSTYGGQGFGGGSTYGGGQGGYGGQTGFSSSPTTTVYPSYL